MTTPEDTELRKSLHFTLKDKVDGKTYNKIYEPLMNLITLHTQKKLEEAISKDPNICEFGHKVYAHNTVDGWCCACEADQAFMGAEIERAVAHLTNPTEEGEK